MNSIPINADYLRALTHISAKADIRYYLNGVFVDIRARETRYIASNGHMLAVIRDEARAEDADQVPARYIIPFATCKTAHSHKGVMAVLHYNAADQLARCTIDNLAKDGVLAFTPIDGKYPDFARVVPSKVDGKPGAYNWSYLDAFDRMAAIAWPVGKNSKPLSVELYQNGAEGAALVLAGGREFLGVVMPVRNNAPGTSPVLPVWWAGEPAKLKAVA